MSRATVGQPDGHRPWLPLLSTPTEDVGRRFIGRQEGFEFKLGQGDVGGGGERGQCRDEPKVAVAGLELEGAPGYGQQVLFG